MPRLRGLLSLLVSLLRLTLHTLLLRLPRAVLRAELLRRWPELVGFPVSQVELNSALDNVQTVVRAYERKLGLP